MTSTQLPLHDIVEAPAVTWWPLAWGWWALIIAALLALTFSFIAWRRRDKRMRARKVARALLNKRYTSMSEINLITKQAALAYFPRERIAPLHGEAWFEFIETTMPPPHRTDFAAQLQPWLNLTYAPQNESNIQVYQQLMQFWIEKALPPKAGRVNNV